MYACMYVFTCLCLYMYVCVCTYVYMYACMYVGCVCMYVYMYVCMHMCVCMCLDGMRVGVDGRGFERNGGESDGRK